MTVQTLKKLMQKKQTARIQTAKTKKKMILQKKMQKQLKQQKTLNNNR